MHIYCVWIWCQFSNFWMAGPCSVCYRSVCCQWRQISSLSHHICRAVKLRIPSDHQHAVNLYCPAPQIFVKVSTWSTPQKQGFRMHVGLAIFPCSDKRIICIILLLTHPLFSPGGEFTLVIFAFSLQYLVRCGYPLRKPLSHSLSLPFKITLSLMWIPSKTLITVSYTVKLYIIYSIKMNLQGKPQCDTLNQLFLV